jgi:hypothetical protein
LWLTSNLAKLPILDARAKRRRFSALLPSRQSGADDESGIRNAESGPCSRSRKGYCRQLLHLLCEREPGGVAQLLASQPEVDTASTQGEDQSFLLQVCL